MGPTANEGAGITTENGEQNETISTKDVEINLVDEVQATDEATLQKSAIAQADQVKQIPSELRAQGIQLSAEQEAQVNQVADKLNAEATKPGLKERMLSDLKKSEKSGKKAGVVIMKGVGWGGEAALGISLAPLTFGTDLVSSMITGKGVFTSGQNGLPALASEVGGIVSLYYVIVGLDAIGVTLEGPLLASGLVAGVINQFICLDSSSTKNAELKNYCAVNAKILKTLWVDPAKGGQSAGAELHKGIMASSRWMMKPFLRHKKKASQETSKQ